MQVTVVENVKMSIRRYFKPVSGLPDPRGQLSQSIPPVAIAEANRLVQEAAQQSTAESTSRKRRPYKTYHPADRLKIAQYACDHGVAAAARFFSRKLKDTISESTVRSICMPTLIIIKSLWIEIFVDRNFRGCLAP